MKTGLWVTTGLLATCLAVGCGQTTTTTGKGSPTGARDSSGTPKPKKLSLTALESQTIKQGDTDKVMVTINRDHFEDAVTLDIEGLPTGVTLVDTHAVIEKGDKVKNLTLKAADDAAVGEKDVTLTASAPGVEKNSQVFKLKVTKK